VSNEERLRAEELTTRILTLIDASDIDSEYVQRNLFIAIGKEQVNRGHHLNTLLKEIVNGEG